jgi:hypothetical protein
MERLDLDLDMLCAALAFTAVAIKGEDKMPDGAARAAGLAYLIKEFCRVTVPEAFADEDAGFTQAVGADIAPQGKFGVAQRMADAIVRLMQENEGCLPQDLIAEGFTPEEIERHWAMARALAQVQLNMLDS